MPKFIMIVTMVVILGTLFGVVGYLLNGGTIMQMRQKPMSAKTEVKQVVLDEDFLITLPANPSTGYSWTADFDKNYLMLRSKDFVSDKVSPETVGAGGKEVFTFMPIKAGKTTIKMGYGRSWESKAIKTKVFKYNIQGNKEVTISTDKTEYEQGEKITATLSYKDKIYQWDKYAWSIQKLENNTWVVIQRRGDPYFFCSNTPECKDVNLRTVEKCSSIVLCESSMWYEVVDMPKLIWDQSYKVEEKNFSCEIPAHLGDARRLDDRSCAIFSQVPAGKYKIRFEYTVSVNPDDLFSREVDIRYTENEFTIKEKITIDSRCEEKAKVSNICSKIGFEYNSDKKKCVVVNGAGCIDNLPFNSLEECQRTCEKSQTDFYSCAQDSDCAKVKDGCCGCNAGGAAIAINKKFEKEWQNKLSTECREIMCPQVISNNPSCFAEPKCKNGKCVLESKSEL